MAFRADLAAALSSMGRLEAFIEEIGRLPRKVSVIAAPKISRLLKRQFTQGVDPYGRTWRKLADGRKSRLTNTGTLKRGTKAMPMGGGNRAGLKVVLGAPYGYFHQVGTRTMPARRIFPQQGMPAEWRKVLTLAAQQAVRDAKRRSRVR